MIRTKKCVLAVLALTSMLTSTLTATAIKSSETSDFFNKTVVSYAKTQEKAVKNGLQSHAKGAYVCESASGTEIYAKDAEKRLPIASMCKIMTLLLCFDAINEGNLSLDETVVASEKAASMGGSQVFLDANGEYVVKELLKSIVVCSANDSCVAMAEKLCGSEGVFVDKMNEKAAALGMNNTLFANCTGLPKEPQYSCAKDVAKMLCELVKNEEYLTYSRIWMEDFKHPSGRVTGMTNTNKLVRFYNGCDGGKTGFTSQAGFCLAATAMRGNMRVISVVIGEDSSDMRFQDVRETFDYAFSQYTLKSVVDERVCLSETALVSGGKKPCVSVKSARSVYLFGKRGEKENIRVETTLFEGLKAPVKIGQTVGEITVYKDNIETDRVPVIAVENVEKATLFDRYKEIAENWNF